MANLLRVSIGGAMPGGEKWSINPCFNLIDFGEPIGDGIAQLAAVAVANVTVPSTLFSLNASGVQTTDFKVEGRTYSGDLDGLGAFSYGSGSGGTGSTPHPFQTSVVVSLRTAVNRASGRGRLYWPATGVTLSSSSLRMATGTVTGALGAFKTYLSGIQSALSAVPGITSATLGVWSRKEEACYHVTKLQMGDVTDVQRRRRDKLIEAYSDTSFP